MVTKRYRERPGRFVSKIWPTSRGDSPKRGYIGRPHTPSKYVVQHYKERDVGHRKLEKIAARLRKKGAKINWFDQAHDVGFSVVWPRKKVKIKKTLL